MPHSRGGALWRFFLAAVVVISATAATTAVAGLLQFKQLAVDISLTPALRNAQVTLPDPGEPQTILIIGSDHRAGERFGAANTDTMMLVRLNGSSQTINVMSIPRDLQVTIPGFGQAKLNAAYSDGGPNLLIRSIKGNVFPNLHVNHIVDVNFGSFEKLVNAIGCVYSDVDHRYYNNTALTNYSSINIQPGYQRLCGANALAFVRFRHTDNDLVRNARQQDFIRWAKDQYGVANIINNRDKLVRIFGANTQTDGNLHTTDGLINLFNLVAFSAGHTIKQIKFPAYQLPGCGGTGVNGATTPCYLTSTASAEAGVFRTFMRSTTTAAVKKAGNAGHGGNSHSARIQAAGLTPDSADGHSQANALRGAGMPVYFPRLVTSGSTYCSDQTSICPLEAPSPGSYPRRYTLRDQRGHRHPAYRMTVVMNPMLGQYYGVEGTSWLHPPLLSKPSSTRTVGGKRLMLFAQGGKLVNVAWRTPHAVYWISNTLTSDISNREMLGIAASLTR
ncbi:MAG: LCP family protein [Actinomycetota bacterium]|nr:LCP family protein [Actinomycetota bacterium]